MENDPLALLRDRIDLVTVPFTERGSRILVTRAGHALNIRLAERWLKLDHRLSGYRSRPPIVEELTFTAADGTPLPFTAHTAPHCLDFDTAAGSFTLAFVDTETLLLRLPEAACGLTFRVRVDQGQPDRRGGVLRMTGDIRRNIAYTTGRAMRLNTIEPYPEGGVVVRLQFAPGAASAWLLNITPRLGFNRYLPDAEAVLREAGQIWRSWFAGLPVVSETYRAQYYYAWWIMRVGLISTRFYTTREAMTPSKTYYVGVWQWDAYFHALAYRHIDRRLAHDQLRIMLDHQRADGMIPDAVHDEGLVTHLDTPVSADVTKPPLLAWAAWKLFEQHGDREFLEEIYEPVARWNRWWLEQSDSDGDGLCEYLHPFSSGLDNSPLWDGGMPVTAPDLNTYLVLQMEALGRMAGVLGLQDEALAWEDAAQTHLERMIARLWDEQAGLFQALRGGERVPVVTPFNLLPLITGRLPRAMNDRLVAHLTDPQQFWTEFPLATVARNDPTYSPEEMWRGPVWINVNYLFVEGLQRAGYPYLAAELRRRTLDLVMRSNDIVEYYHPETGRPCPKAAPIFGWSAALFIDLALQETGEA